MEVTELLTDDDDAESYCSGHREEIQHLKRQEMWQNRCLKALVETKI